jgi:ribosomal protein L11 methyltransferase
MSENIWLVELEIPACAVEVFMDELASYADSMSCFECENDKIWKLQLYKQTEPDLQVIKDEASRLSLLYGINCPNIECQQIENIDWVAESQKNFEAVEAGSLFIYPSWRRSEIPDNKIAIEIDPAQAFGTGGHETTKGCLLAIQNLAWIKPKNILDIGCGSGLLGIAAAKIFNDVKVTAVDNDPICIDITKENAKLNNVEQYFKCGLSEGYEAQIVKENATYDLILSNILTLPLIEFAPVVRTFISKGGYIILAGLLNKHADEVIKAHKEQDFELVAHDIYGNWSVLTMKF